MEPVPSDSGFPIKRISVIGVSGSGKSTFARELASAMNVACVELDSLHWEANWTEADDEVFRERVQIALQGDLWVCDGNYSKVREDVWSRADTVIWLDYSFSLIAYRLVSRTMSRIFSREKLWAGNQESAATQFLTGDSIFLWAFKTYFRYKIEYPKILREPQYAHLNLIRFRYPGDAEDFIRRKGKP